MHNIFVKEISCFKAIFHFSYLHVFKESLYFTEKVEQMGCANL